MIESVGNCVKHHHHDYRPNKNNHVYYNDHHDEDNNAQVVDTDGKTVLATLKAGSYFGEISILNMGTAGASSS